MGTKNLSSLFGSSSTSGIKWERPVHETVGQFSIVSGATGCVCVPSTATRVVVEMWGQGGGGGGACCCSYGSYGGQGGYYAKKVWEGANSPAALGQCMSFCGCVCSCDCQSYTHDGHAGQFAWLRNCNTTTSAPVGCWYGCVPGGYSGYTYCTADNWYCNSWKCRGQYDTDNLINPTNNLIGTSNPYFTCTALNSAGSASCSCGGAGVCVNGTGCNGLPGIGFSIPTVTSSISLDSIFAPITCTCFDFMRAGACGWTCAQKNSVTNCPQQMYLGVGGAAYAGGGQQFFSSQTTNSCYCGAGGNFPGGGGRSSGVCGGACNTGSIGGGGLILISWK